MRKSCPTGASLKSLLGNASLFGLTKRKLSATRKQNEVQSPKPSCVLLTSKITSFNSNFKG